MVSGDGQTRGIVVSLSCVTVMPCKESENSWSKWQQICVSCFVWRYIYLSSGVGALRYTDVEPLVGSSLVKHSWIIWGEYNDEDPVGSSGNCFVCSVRDSSNEKRSVYKDWRAFICSCMFVWQTSKRHTLRQKKTKVLNGATQTQTKKQSGFQFPFNGTDIAGSIKPPGS